MHMPLNIPGCIGKQKPKQKKLYQIDWLCTWDNFGYYIKIFFFLENFLGIFCYILLSCPCCLVSWHSYLVVCPDCVLCQHLESPGSSEAYCAFWLVCWSGLFSVSLATLSDTSYSAASLCEMLSWPLPRQSLLKGVPVHLVGIVLASVCGHGFQSW